ncbi:cytochrome P450 [Sulfobacillus harzensis]|uniref:Cytochrome P450 n=1 Tax=Sulfobacillus harzensis TaxID=2729629 RepID=A0A7Y0L643_9FIRM|nr:cytochrome P450 [Sulfobacillus harzensis]NMP22614.1 cytochrome P450 [Sulfobacillus harzensis]
MSIERDLRNPYSWYDEARNKCPVYWDHAEEGWLVLSHELINEVLLNPKFAARADMSFMGEVAPTLRQHFESWLLFTDPPKHNVLRKLIGPAFSSKRYPSFERTLSDRANTLVDRLLLENGPFDLLSQYAIPMAECALAMILTLDGQEVANAREWADDLLDFINVDFSPEQLAVSLKALNAMTKIVKDKVLTSKASFPKGTILSTINQAWSQGEISEVEAGALFGQIVTGMLGAVPHLVSNAVLALVQHPAQWSRLQSNPDAIDGAVEEFLRYDTPFLLVTRTSTAEMTLGGVALHPGDRIGLMLGAGNRDPATFEHPHALDVERRPNPHLSFGIGAHFCLGAGMTRSIASVAIGTLTRRVRKIELHEPVRFRQLFGMRNAEELMVSMEAK